MKICIQMWRELCCSEPLTRLRPSDHEITLGSLARAFFRAQSWPQPANYARKDWTDHLRQVGVCAAVQAVERHEHCAAVPLGAYLYQQVIGTVWTEYRREWRYSKRYRSLPDELSAVESEISEAQTNLPPRYADISWMAQDSESTQAVDDLAEPHRRLLIRLFWHGESEAEVAKELKLSQTGIHRRKARALEAFRSGLYPEN